MGLDSTNGQSEKLENNKWDGSEMRRHGSTGFRRSDIEAHHGELQDHFSQHLEERAIIDKAEKWHRRPDKEEVAFDLIGTISGRGERATRKRGLSHPVLAAKQRAAWWIDCESWTWVSWREEWVSIMAKTFELKTAGLTVFWGPRDDKRQIIRAEWAQPPKHGGNAGQPHWHADFDEIIRSAADGESGRSSFGISLTDCHLAMAGWRGAQISGMPWQSCVGEELSTLSHWASMTLEYVITQLAGCRRPKS